MLLILFILGVASFIVWIRVSIVAQSVSVARKLLDLDLAESLKKELKPLLAIAYLFTYLFFFGTNFVLFFLGDFRWI